MLGNGCASSRAPVNNWPIPILATSLPVDFKPVVGDYFISDEHATNLATNIEEWEAYAEKLRVLVDEILRKIERCLL